MSNQINVNGILKSADDYLALDQTVPANDTADGNGGSFDLGNTQGSLEVVAEVGTEVIEIADTKTITVKLQQSSDNGQADAFEDLKTVYELTSNGGDTLEVGTILGRYVLPISAERYIKAVIETSDDSAVGKLNVFLAYIPR